MFFLIKIHISTFKNLRLCLLPTFKTLSSHKLDFKCKKSLFLGYSQLHNGYKCLPCSEKICISKDILFNELKFSCVGIFPNTPNYVKNISWYFN